MLRPDARRPPLPHQPLRRARSTQSVCGSSLDASDPAPLLSTLGGAPSASLGVGASRRRHNGRVAPYAAARLTGRARGRAWRQNAGNSPAHPTSLFSPQSARGEPRHVGCSAPSTTSARPHALFRGFSYKNFAETGPIAGLRVVWIQNPCGGTKCACFRACARVCRGGSLGHFQRKRNFWRFMPQTFRHTWRESVPTLQGS